MRWVGLSIGFIIVAGCASNGQGDSPGDAGVLADAADGSFPAEVVWVGAHPDDELYAAPWLAQRCLADGAACKFVVLTRGEAGQCKKPSGCAPDLATVRASELASSVALFEAQLVQLDLGDAVAPDTDGVGAEWSRRGGGDAALTSQIARELAGAQELVTFDPRHGDSCHPDHRVAGALAILAAREANLPESAVTMIASRLVVEPAVADDTSLTPYDGSVVMPATGSSGWATLVDVLSLYESQFNASEVQSIESVPSDAQLNWLLRLDLADAADPRYESLCASANSL